MKPPKGPIGELARRLLPHATWDVIKEAGKIVWEYRGLITGESGTIALMILLFKHHPYISLVVGGGVTSILMFVVGIVIGRRTGHIREDQKGENLKLDLQARGGLSSDITGKEPIAATQGPPPQQAIPVIDFVEARMAILSRNGWLKVWDEIPSSSGHLGLIAVFKNGLKDVGKETPTLRAVTAHMTYTSGEGKQQQIDSGCWLKEYTHFVDFDPGQTQALIIAVEIYENHPPSVLNNPIASIPRIQSATNAIHSPQLQPIIAQPCRVEIMLVEDNVTVYKARFTFRRTADRGMELKPDHL
jgi:hypothetical protein